MAHGSTATQPFGGFALPLRGLLALASLATTAVALWLLLVTAFVLPSRDPAQIPMWTAVAIAMLLYSGLCLVHLGGPPRAESLRRVVLAVSIVAMVAGVYAVTEMLQADSARFEGYLLLIGVIVGGHGLVAFLDAGLSMLAARRPAEG
jgi:uncharacterized membrane protein HdeD (DUF308 family)